MDFYVQKLNVDMLLDDEKVTKPVYIICQSTLRSYVAARVLTGNGFDCYNFTGGYHYYGVVKHDRCMIEQAVVYGIE